MTISYGKEKQPRIFYGYIIETSAFCIMSMAWGANRSFGVFLEPLLNEFGWSRTSISGAFTLGMIILGLTSLAAGRLTDIIGPKKVLIACALFLGSGYLLMSQISSIWEFYLYAGVLTGIGMSGMLAPLLSLIARWFVKRRSLMSGILASGPALGIAVLPLVLSLLITSMGWRNSYIVLGLFLLIVIIPAAMLLRRDPEEMGLKPYGDEQLSVNSATNIEGLFPGESLHTAQFWMMALIAFCAMFTINVYVVHIVIHAIGLGISSSAAATILSLAAAVSVPGRIAAGAIADRIGDRLALILCFFMALTAYVLIISAKGIVLFYIAAIIFGGAGWATGVLITPLTASLFGLRSHGTILAFVMMGATAGGAAGPVLIGYVFDITGSYRLGFIITISVILLAIITSLFLKPLAERKHL
ncbi:MAG: MFS transporter [Deltaproteobacteria bacterium]|nr:MFS transporter [Deltaproteobacteria bacterium]